MKTIERIKQIIEYKGVTNNFFEKKINVGTGYIGKQLRTNGSVGSDILENILNIYPDINSEWLILGKGNMILGDDTYKSPSKAISTPVGIPLLPVEAFAGIASNVDFAVVFDTIEERYVIPLFANKGIDFLIPIRGTSMYPTFSSGDIVACKLVREIVFLQWNKIYVIATKSQGVIAKRLKQSSHADTVICRSDNAEYDDFEIPLSEIENIAIVLGIIKLE